MAMSYASLTIPFVLGYIALVWYCLWPTVIYLGFKVSVRNAMKLEK